MTSEEEETQEESSETGDSHQTIAKGGATMLAGTLVGLPLAFLAKAVPARLLGPEGYGLIVLAFTVASTVAILGQLGLQQGIARNLPRYEQLKGKRGVVLSAFSLSLPASLVLAGGVFLLAEPISSEIFGDQALTPVLRIFTLAIPLISLQRLSISTFRGYKRTREPVLINNILNNGGRFVLITLAILLGFGIAGAAWGWILGLLLTTGVGLYLLRRNTEILDRGNWTREHRSLITFSLPLLASSVMWVLLGRADNFLIGYYLPASDVGVYDATFSLGKLVDSGLGALSFVFLPVLSGLHANGRWGEMNRVYKVVTKWAVSMTLPFFLFLIIFPSEILTLLFGSDYAAGSLTLLFIATGFFAHVLSGLNGEALISFGYTKFLMTGNVITLAANIVLNILLIPRYGIAGAAAASALTYAGSNMIFLLKLFRVSGIHPFSTALLRPVILSSAIIFVAQHLAKGFGDIRMWMLPLFFLLFFSIYGLVFLRFGGLEQEDIELLMEIEEKSGIDLSGFKWFVKKVSDL